MPLARYVIFAALFLSCVARCTAGKSVAPDTAATLGMRIRRSADIRRGGQPFKKAGLFSIDSLTSPQA